jgi:hypothetical protein
MNQFHASLHVYLTARDKLQNKHMQICTNTKRQTKRSQSTWTKLESSKASDITRWENVYTLLTINILTCRKNHYEYERKIFLTMIQAASSRVRFPIRSLKF